MTESAERLRAVRGLRRVIDKGQTLDQVEAAGTALTPLARELLYGSVRHYFSLSDAVAARLKRPLLPKHPDLWSLLIIGAYQLFHTRVPDHASISTSVALTQALGKGWAKGLINGVLRNLQREPSPPPHSEHPTWLEAMLRSQYGSTADALLAANNQRAPMALRVNGLHNSRSEYLDQLQQASIAATGGHTAESVLLAQPQPVSALPGFNAGAVSVQDIGAQLAAEVWSNPPQHNLRMLDACAAPGGKLHHLRERRPEDHYLALERSESRLAHTRADAQRLGFAATGYLQADAQDTQWWDQSPFERILIDAPCSGTGTLRRHPDIKLHLQAEAITTHATTQLALLTALWPTLRDDGELLYCTCSLLREENDAVVQDFLEEHADAQAEPFRLPSGSPTEHGWQLTPLDPTTDGFYYARLRKRRQ